MHDKLTTEEITTKVNQDWEDAQETPLVDPLLQAEREARNDLRRLRDQQVKSMDSLPPAGTEGVKLKKEKPLLPGVDLRRVQKKFEDAGKPNGWVKDD